MPRGHCHDWFRKWKREHNFCGLRPQDAKEMDRYIDLTEKIAGNGSGMDEDFIHDHFTAGAARPLLRCKDDAAYEKGLNYVVACLKREEMITGGDLQATIDGLTGKGTRKPKESTQMRQENPSVPMESTQMRTQEIPDPSGAPLSDRLKDEPHGTSAFHTAAQELAAKQNGIAGEMFPDPVVKETLTAPTWTSAACPACEHVIIQKVLGNKCKQTGGLCQDVKECPVERRKQMAQEQGFVIAGSGAPSLQGKPITTEHPPLKVIPVQLTKEQAEAAITSVVRGYFTPKSREQWTQLKKIGGWDTDLEAMEGLRDDAAERME